MHSIDILFTEEERNRKGDEEPISKSKLWAMIKKSFTCDYKVPIAAFLAMARMQRQVVVVVGGWCLPTPFLIGRWRMNGGDTGCQILKRRSKRRKSPSPTKSESASSS